MFHICATCDELYIKCLCNCPTKKCKKCEEIKNWDDFYKKRAICKKCVVSPYIKKEPLKELYMKKDDIMDKIEKGYKLSVITKELNLGKYQLQNHIKKLRSN